MAIDFSRQQQGAFDLLKDILKQYGLSSLNGALKNIILNGVTDEQQIMLQLQDTPEWKIRFKGNEILTQKGLPKLSVAEYLSVERSYAQIMKNYGLPSGFYDDPSDFANWIGGSVSANELQQRVQMYADLYQREDPAIVDQLQSMGLSKGDILAHLIDPNRAAPLLQKKYQTTLIGAAARRTGVVATDAERLAELGITEQQATQGYAQIKNELADATRLADIYGDGLEQSDLEAETFEGAAEVTRKKRRLASQERASFGGNSGVGGNSLSRSSQGSF